MQGNLEAYKVFYYVAKYGGITIASEKLCISQPAVSQSIKQMEQNLGVSLFIRTSKGTKLTKEGELLYHYVKEGYETIMKGEGKLREWLNLEDGEIRIGASDMTLRYYLLPYLEKFHEQYPKVKVSVTNGPTPETLSYLKDGRIDFGVVTEPIQKGRDYKIYSVREIEDIFIAGSKFTFLKDASLSYKELEHNPVICLEPNTSTRTYVDHWLSTHQVELKPEIELATSDMIIQFAKRNFGIGCVVKDFAKSSLEKEELFELQFQKKIPKRHILLVASKHNSISKAAEKLLNLMIGEEK
ncbi:MAG: LysR family transcriptional regulator [Firmicutes bacterium]|uniref:LysR family transcriptional regulator n=1 Tax=Candidatus Scybalomonas excrementavium TaxID=2840943 RepID=A0A9D9N8Q7_9FIRM|nr:LysR family transcriptional regulator [Candidatus Scybalomonas excrementavium]